MPTAAYQPRRCVPLPALGADGMRLKRVWIDAQGAAAPPHALAVSAWDVAATLVPRAAGAEGASAGLGFVILHRGDAGSWLLMHWWAHGDICCQLLGHAAPGATAFDDVSARPLMACVWELPVIAAERAAWVDTMLSGAPDADGYIARTVTDGAV